MSLPPDTDPRPADPELERLARFWADLAGDQRVTWGVRPSDPMLGGHGAVYLATPYSRLALDPAGAFSFPLATKAARRAVLALRDVTLAGVGAISPIVQSHAIIASMWHEAEGDEGARQVAAFALDAAYWERVNRPHLNVCRAIYVPAVPGWDRSTGIAVEVEAMLARNRPVMIAVPAFAVAPARSEG